jgi:antitoxin component YwqK of YwqJK toxin-antitoxin module
MSCELVNFSGVHVTRYENGQASVESTYVNGVLHGEFKYYTESGIMVEIGNHVNGELHGEFKSWNNDGTPRAECNYTNGNFKLYDDEGNVSLNITIRN